MSDDGFHDLVLGCRVLDDGFHGLVLDLVEGFGCRSVLKDPCASE